MNIKYKTQERVMHLPKYLAHNLKIYQTPIQMKIKIKMRNRIQGV